MSEDLLNAGSRAGGTRRLLYLAIGFPIAMVAAGFAMIRLDLGWPGVAFLLLIGMAMTFALARMGQEKMRSLGCASPAILRYNGRMMIASLAYMAVFFLAVYVYAELKVRGPLLWVLAFATILPVLAMIWAMGRLLVEESDEYLRSRIVRQALFGTGGLLAVTTVWGFLEQFMLVPHVPAWAALPIFAIMLGVSNLFPANR